MQTEKTQDCCISESPCNQVAPVFLEYEEKLKGFIQKQVKDKEAAQEITQQLFLKIYNNCEQLPQVYNKKAWLYQITRNAVFDFFRENKHVVYLQPNEDLEQQPDHTFNKELLECVRPLINLLPPAYAQPLLLSDIEGIPQKEIAEKLGISLSGAKSRIQRGREKLKALFIECCYLELDREGNIVSADIKETCTPLKQLRQKLTSEKGTNITGYL
ncbi:RNA polymerase sigma factor SigZ [Adhaeribacter aquaticus]|uniref:RNA polymerase sigma factor SigZ n=1 Tax=Adhaeribacter aquaticus TaxID=299567 RepID=UPI0003F8F6BC|nr:RNA polymerase sigma factor SigZ [Adhaeribacter aquaticus]